MSCPTARPDAAFRARSRPEMEEVDDEDRGKSQWPLLESSAMILFADRVASPPLDVSSPHIMLEVSPCMICAELHCFGIY